MGPFSCLWNISPFSQVAHPLASKLPVLSTPTELIWCESCSLLSAPFRTLLFLTCFHTPSRMQESLVFDDLVFQDFNLLYFEIEIPAPARDRTLTADVLNFLQLQQLRKSISSLYFLQCTICQEARIQAVVVKPRAVSTPPGQGIR